MNVAHTNTGAKQWVQWAMTRERFFQPLDISTNVSDDYTHSGYMRRSIAGLFFFFANWTCEMGI